MVFPQVWFIIQHIVDDVEQEEVVAVDFSLQKLE